MANAAPVIALGTFLETVPPGRLVYLSADKSVMTKEWSGHYYFVKLKLPNLSLYCSEPTCERMQFFRPLLNQESVSAPGDRYLGYVCKNCGNTFKTFSIRFTSEGEADLTTLYAQKFGEIPQFGPPLPAKLLQLAGEMQDVLKKGRQSENQSLGIGAFAYYRRIVETQKSRLIDELKNAIERLGGNTKTLQALEEARTETQFSKALQQMADVTPKELFIAGQNPLKLLHGPLSVGLHGLSDEECLTKAHSIRIVLGALLERIQMVTEEKAELDAAIKDLLPPG